MNFVDLGLPFLVADCNCGTDNPAEFGTLYDAFELPEPPEGCKIPEVVDIAQVLEHCEFQVIGNCFLVTGKTTNQILIPMSGYEIDCPEKQAKGGYEDEACLWLAKEKIADKGFGFYFKVRDFKERVCPTVKVGRHEYKYPVRFIKYK